jgi:hypothetical protein
MIRNIRVLTPISNSEARVVLCTLPLLPGPLISRESENQPICGVLSNIHLIRMYISIVDEDGSISGIFLSRILYTGTGRRPARPIQNRESGKGGGHLTGSQSTSLLT